LLPFGARAVTYEPNKAHFDGLSIQLVICVELAAPIRKPSHYRFVQLAWIAAVQPPDGPGHRLGVERAKGNGTNFAFWKEEAVVLQIAEPSKDLLCGRQSVELNPIGALSQS
jgi:hypothetical protein